MIFTNEQISKLREIQNNQNAPLREMLEVVFNRWIGDEIHPLRYKYGLATDVDTKRFISPNDCSCLLSTYLVGKYQNEEEIIEKRIAKDIFGSSEEWKKIFYLREGFDNSSEESLEYKKYYDLGRAIAAIIWDEIY